MPYVARARDMLYMVCEHDKKQSPSYDLQHFVSSKRRLHGYWIEDKEKVSMVCENTRCRVPGENIFYLTECLNDFICFPLVRGLVLLTFMK